MSDFTVKIPADVFYRMEQDYANIKECLKHYEQENEQIRQALRKCSPFRLVADDEICYSCGISAFNSLPHKANCDYIRLTQTNK
jgi:hypothetical protein